MYVRPWALAESSQRRRVARLFRLPIEQGNARHVAEWRAHRVLWIRHALARVVEVNGVIYGMDETPLWKLVVQRRVSDVDPELCPNRFANAGAELHAGALVPNWL